MVMRNGGGCVIIFLVERRPPTSTLVPCTALFRPARAASARRPAGEAAVGRPALGGWGGLALGRRRRLRAGRSAEHRSELQSRQYLVCRLLLEKQNITPATAHRGARPNGCAHVLS